MPQLKDDVVRLLTEWDALARRLRDEGCIVVQAMAHPGVPRRESGFYWSGGLCEPRATLRLRTLQHELLGHLERLSGGEPAVPHEQVTCDLGRGEFEQRTLAAQLQRADLGPIVLLPAPVESHAPAEVPATPPPPGTLTADERAVLEHLVKAWDAYRNLPDRKDSIEFSRTVHRLQDLVALRAARRANPDVFA